MLVSVAPLCSVPCVGPRLYGCHLYCFFTYFLWSNRDASSQQEEKVAVQTTHLLRNQFQKPKSNVGKEAEGGEVPGVGKDVSEDNSEKDNSLIQCHSKCSMLPDLDVSFLDFFN